VSLSPWVLRATLKLVFCVTPLQWTVWANWAVGILENSQISSPDSVLRSISRLVLESGRSELSAKRKRGFHRLVSGFTRAHYRGDRLRFMTLTSAVGGSVRVIRRHLQVLRKRIHREFGFLIQYWSIATNEGNGVLHIVFKGGFIPQSWLSSAWSAIHGARIVDIRVLRGSSRRLASYLVANYLCKQSFERMSWSWGWVFRGFCGVWASHFSSWYKVNSKACLRAWNKLICQFSESVPFVQGKLGG